MVFKVLQHAGVSQCSTDDCFSLESKPGYSPQAGHYNETNSDPPLGNHIFLKYWHNCTYWHKSQHSQVSTFHAVSTGTSLNIHQMQTIIIIGVNFNISIGTSLSYKLLLRIGISLTQARVVYHVAYQWEIPRG